MKTLRKIGVAFMAAVLVFGFASCGNDEDGIELDKTIKETIADAILKMSKEVTLPAPGSGTSPKVIKPKYGPISSLVITDEEVIIYKSDSKAIVDGENVFVGNYIMDGTNLVIENDELGKIVVSMEGVMSLMLEGHSYECEAVEVPATATATGVNLCRTWKSPSYQAAVYFDKLPIYGVKEQKTQKQITVLAKEVCDKILAQDSKLVDEGFEILSSDIVSMNFTNDGTLYIAYANGKVEDTKWEWIDEANGKMRVSTIDNFDNKGQGLAVEVRYEKGATNKAYFVIDANCSGIGNLGVHSLSGRLIVTMTD